MKMSSELLLFSLKACLPNLCVRGELETDVMVFSHTCLAVSNSFMEFLLLTITRNPIHKKEIMLIMLIPLISHVFYIL